MAKIKKLQPWYLIKLRSSNKDKNSETDEISVTDFTSQLTDTIVDDVTIKKDPNTGNIYVSTVNTVSEGNVTMSERTILSGTNLGANADIIASILGGGNAGQVLKSIGDGTTPTWQNESGGGGADSRKSRVAYNTIMNSNY